MKLDESLEVVIKKPQADSTVDNNMLFIYHLLIAGAS
jgi:hypothetical protein